MDIATSGFILYTINYPECVSFYENILELKVLYRKPTLTCFDFYGSYLMVEIDDQTDQKVLETSERDKFCIRLNVKDVMEACKVLDRHAVTYSYNKYDWGTIAKFRDPDGNLIGFRSADGHEQDLNQA